MLRSLLLHLLVDRAIDLVEDADMRLTMLMKQHMVVLVLNANLAILLAIYIAQSSQQPDFVLCTMVIR